MGDYFYVIECHGMPNERQIQQAMCVILKHFV